MRNAAHKYNKSMTLQVIEKFKRLTYCSTYTYPLVIKDGHECFINDVDGNEFLDFTSNIGSCPLGYSHPYIMEALNEFSKIGMHKIAGQDFYCEEHARIAEQLLSISSKNMKAFFINSGAEAVENAIKLAYRSRGPLPGISCINAFHGRTLGALTFTYSKDVQKSNFPEFPVKRIKFCTKDDDPEIDTIQNVINKNKVAFIMCEAIQGEGGMNVASNKFMKNLEKCAVQYQVPLILDEVQCGMGRTGKWWAYQHYGIKPNLITVAKALQVGAVVFERRYEPNEQGVLSSTWGGGSRIDMEIGCRIIETISKKHLLLNSETMGNKVLKRLKEIAEHDSYKQICDVRGIGLMIGVEFTSRINRDRFVKDLFKQKLLVLPSGKCSIRIMPPLIIEEQQVNQGLDTIEFVLNKKN